MAVRGNLFVNDCINIILGIITQDLPNYRCSNTSIHTEYINAVFLHCRVISR